MEKSEARLHTTNNPSIWYRFDGPIVRDNKISLRTTARTADHLQSAIDRAYLETRYGDVFKYQKLKKHEYEVVDFIVLPSSPGSFIQSIEALRKSEITQSIVNKIDAALGRAYAKTKQDIDPASPSIKEQALQRAQVFQKNQEAPNYKELVDSEIKSLTDAYSERSINKEIDQILALLRQDNHIGSTLEMSLYGSKPLGKYDFNHFTAERFHKIVAERRVGKPFILDIELRSLDAGKAGSIATGKGKNLTSGKECSMLIPDPVVFGKLAPHLRRVRRKKLSLVACPIFEYDAWDPVAGDIVVIKFLSAATSDD